jgi:hypothetical protein
LSSLTTDSGGGLVLSGMSQQQQVTEAVTLGAAFAEPVELPKPPLYARVDPVTACAKNFAAYRHTHFEPKDLGIMGYFSAQCGFYLPLAGAKPEDVLPHMGLIVDASNKAGPTYEAATATCDAVWKSLAGE